MLSLHQSGSPNGSYHCGHHRQNSSPAVIDPRKAFSPVTPQSPGSFHRRGSSFESPMQHPGTPTYYPGTPTRSIPETHDNTNIQQPAMHQHLAHKAQEQQNSPRPGQDTDFFNDYFQNITNSNTAPQPDFGRPTSIHALSNRNSNSSLEEDLKELLRKHNATDRDLASVLLDQGRLGQGPVAGQENETACNEVQALPARTNSIALPDQLPQLRPLLQRPSTPPNRMPNGEYRIRHYFRTGLIAFQGSIF